MTPREVLALMRRSSFWVEATTHANGAPQAAVIGVAVGDSFELVFDTLDSTRKCANLRREPRVALAMWAGEATVQVEGVTDEPTGAELAAAKRVYFATFPDGPDREKWAGITYVRVKPTWIRATDFSGAEPAITELRPPFSSTG
jgi:hypothetical protein